MQNEEIKFKIEEIEKRLSKTYKTGNTNNLEVEKRLKSLEASRSFANMQIESLVSNVSSLGTVDEQHLLRFEIVNNRLDALEEGNGGGGNNPQIEVNRLAIEGLTTEVANLKTTDNQILGEISNINTKNNEISAKITEINSKIDSFSETNSNDIPETFNFFNKELFESGSEFYGLMQNFLTCFFLCEPTSMCRIKVKAEFDIIHEKEFSVTLNSILNDEIIDSRSYTVNGTESHSFEFEHDFYPETSNNNLLFKSTATNSINI